MNFTLSDLSPRTGSSGRKPAQFCIASFHYARLKYSHIAPSQPGSNLLFWTY